MNIDRIYATPRIEWLDFHGSKPFDRQKEMRNSFAGLSDHVPILGTLHLS